MKLGLLKALAEYDQKLAEMRDWFATLSSEETIELHAQLRTLETESPPTSFERAAASLGLMMLLSFCAARYEREESGS